jgi:PAS domain S-box-containing protein
MDLTGTPQAVSALALRQRAEANLQKKAKLSSEELRALSPETTQAMLHEMQVHQIELEMQNEELRRMQVTLDAARARYFDLYDQAPVGYVTIGERRLILEANLTAATLLGAVRNALVQQPLSRFIQHEDQDIWYQRRKQLLATGEPQTCDLRMVRIDGTPFWAHLKATVAQDVDGAPVCRVTLSDITKRKRTEWEFTGTAEGTAVSSRHLHPEAFAGYLLPRADGENY